MTATSKFRSSLTFLASVLASAGFSTIATAQSSGGHSCTLPASCYVAPYSVPTGCPTSSVTAVQDQAALMCQQGLQFPTVNSNPPLSSSRGNDPYAPANAFPGTPTSASSINTSNWTDALNHTIVRWGWGQWTTYDDSQGGGTPNLGCGDPINGSSTCTKALELGTATGGAMAYGGAGDLGPVGGRPYPDGACSTPGCLSATTYPAIDLFTMKNGTPILTPTDWWVKRRPEIWNLVQQEIYGSAFPSSFNTSAINNWTIGAVTTATVTGAISVSTVPGQPTNAPIFPVAPLPTIACTGTSNCTGTYTPPAGTPGVTAGKYNARIKTYTAHFNLPYNGFTPRNSPSLVFTCELPANAIGKVPVVIAISESDADSQYTLPYGYGVCGYTNTGLQADGGGASTSSYLSGMFSGGTWRTPSDPGTLVAWAWGISRFIDFLQAGGDPDPIGPDPDKIAVEGHSRDGKATLVSMAYDNRLVAGLPSCGGEGGTSWLRRNFGESIESIVGNGEYYWMAGDLMNYAGPECSTNPNRGPAGCTPAFFPRAVQDLDVDVHSVMSLLAPRAVMTNGGTDTPAGNGDAWQDPRGMFLAGTMSSPVWNLLGWTGQIIPNGTVFTTNPATWSASESTGGPNGGESIGGTPPFNVAFAGPNGPGGAGSATVAWRRHSAGHTDTPEWPVFAQWAAQYLWDTRPVITAGQSFTLPSGTSNVVGTVAAVPGGGGPLQGWQITGGNAAYIFSLDSNTGSITIPDRKQLNAQIPTYTMSVMVGDSLLPSTKLGVDASVAINMPADLTASGIATVTKGALVYNFTTQRFNQSVTVTNNTVNPISGPISLVLDNLSSNASLFNASGVTSSALPAGSSYVNSTATLSPGQSVSIVLQFTDPTKAGITYTPRILAGAAVR